MIDHFFGSLNSERDEPKEGRYTSARVDTTNMIDTSRSSPNEEGPAANVTLITRRIERK